MTTHPLSNSLISSYTTAGIAGPKPLPELLRPYKEPGLGMELYLFMEPDCRLWFKHWRQTHDEDGISAVEFLASLKPHQLDELAESFRQRFHEELKVPVVAFATFIPEIASDAKSPLAVLARGALNSLIQLAQRLKVATGAARSPVIEVVAGSRVASLDTRDPAMLRAIRITDKAGRANVLKNIELVLRPPATLDPSLDTRIALELEPGPLYLLRDWTTLRRFAAEISANPLLDRYLGFNLDIAHWRMALIKPELVEANEMVCHRLFHAHIAGHHRCGHFGDTSLLCLNNDLDFTPWLRLLKTRTTASFSGYVSLEFEAAKSLSHVSDSVRQLGSLLQGV